MQVLVCRTDPASNLSVDVSHYLSEAELSHLQGDEHLHNKWVYWCLLRRHAVVVVKEFRAAGVVVRCWYVQALRHLTTRHAHADSLCCALFLLRAYHKQDISAGAAAASAGSHQYCG